MVIADHGYAYSRLLKDWDSIGVSYVIRADEGALFDVLESHPICSRQAGWIKSDERVAYAGVQTMKHYPDALRRLVLATSSGEMTLLSNDFQHAASTIADLYRSRWEIETFLGTIKQNLHIKTFFGDEPECRRDSNMDGAHHDAPGEFPQEASTGEVEFLHFSDVLAAEYFLQARPLHLAQLPTFPARGEQLVGYDLKRGYPSESRI